MNIAGRIASRIVREDGGKDGMVECRVKARMKDCMVQWETIEARH